MAPRPALVVPALKKHTATVIVAHGLGDSGAGWVFLAENWRRRGKFEHVKFVFPNAPTIPITVNFGMEIPGWYDIVDFSGLASRQDRPGILNSRNVFTKFITDEIASGTPSNRIVLGGFSQGGAMSIFTGATMPDIKLGGVFGLSCYALLGDEFKKMAAEEAKGVNKATPFFLGHGDEDPLVKHAWGLSTAALLGDLGHKVEFKTYNGLEHSAAPEEIDDLEAFLNECIPPIPE